MEFNVNISMVAAIFILAAIGLIVRLIIWYAEVNSDRKSFKEFMVKVEQNIQKILDKLSGTPPATVPGSPLQLSDYGKKLSDFLKAEEWATETVTTLLPKVRGKDAYQLQEFYNDYVFGEYQPTDQEAQKIRDCIYLNGATRTHVNEVLSLVLRDALLEELGMMQLAS